MSFLFIVFLHLGVVERALSQEQDSKLLTHQLNFTCDNNYFLFRGDDGYYTSGLFAKYDRVRRKDVGSSVKKIYSYELGQMIYNAHSRKILQNPTSMFPGGIQEIDRPVTGYLFGKATRTAFYGNRKMFSVGLSLGSVGKNSLGEWVQETWHRMVGIKNHWNWVWDYQLKNELGVNAHATFAASLLSRGQNPVLQITPVTQVNLGTTFTDWSQSVVFQIGKLRQLSTSSYWNSKLLEPPTGFRGGRTAEVFAFYRPEIKHQLYNATVQGGFFSKDKGPIVSEVVPLVISHEFGVRFSTPKHCLGYQVTIQSKEAKSQFHRQSFASLIYITRISG